MTIMNISEAESIIDNLNAVFSGKSTAVPSLESVRNAIKCITDEIQKTGAEVNREVPELKDGNTGTLAINASSAQLASDLLEFAQQCIQKDKLRDKLEKKLTGNHAIGKKLKI